MSTISDEPRIESASSSDSVSISSISSVSSEDSLNDEEKRKEQLKRQNSLASRKKSVSVYEIKSNKLNKRAIKKIQAQGAKEAVGYTASATAFTMVIFFIENKVNTTVAIMYWVVTALIVFLSFIEPLLSDYFKRNDRLSAEIEEVIIIKIRNGIGALIMGQAAVVSYIFSHTKDNI